MPAHVTWAVISLRKTDAGPLVNFIHQILASELVADGATSATAPAGTQAAIVTGVGAPVYINKGATASAILGLKLLADRTGYFTAQQGDTIRVEAV